MPSSKPNIRFETGNCIRHNIQNPFGPGVKLVTDWQIIGRIEDGTPFFLSYRDPGYTNWSCPTHLGDSLRKKILGRLRTEVRFAKSLPSYITVHDLSADNDTKPSSSSVEQIAMGFFNMWRAEYLGDRDEDYVPLDVPYADKDEAKALGAIWNGSVWRVKRQTDMTPFRRWIKT